MDTSVKRGDIYYADLSPVVGSEQGGVRPVLIIQNDTGNRYSPTVIAAAITSQTGKAKLPTHIDLPVDHSCGLSRDGLKPVTPVKVPTAQKNMIACVKEYERLAVAAILQQDKSLAVRALMAHPLIGSYSLAKTLVEAYLDDEQFAAWR